MPPRLHVAVDRTKPRCHQMWYHIRLSKSLAIGSNTTPVNAIFGPASSRLGVEMLRLRLLLRCTIRMVLPDPVNKCDHEQEAVDV